MNVKIINLNLYEGGLLEENIHKFITEQNADIWCFQEVFNSTEKSLPKKYRSIEVLKNLLPNYHFNFAPELLSQAKVGNIDIGNAIFSRYPISRTKTTFISGEYGSFPAKPAHKDWSVHPKNMQLATIEVGESFLNIFNLHGVWGLDGKDTPLRLEMSKKIVTEIEKKQNVILCGDFNVQPNTETIQNIELYLINIFKDELTTSFNLTRKNLEKFPGYATAVVDMMFASKDINVISHECPQVDVSDHLPLVIEIEVK
jgi:endonuclease/exonuclease/phosphatase family metal-dependent hydrolase